jgi:DNA-binding protein Fis
VDQLQTSNTGTPANLSTISTTQAPIQGGVRADIRNLGAPAELDADLAQKLDQYSLETVVEFKIARFLDQLGTFYPENLHELIIQKVEKPLIAQILRRVGGNQVHASRILGINRNTLRKKMKMYGYS